MTNVNDNRDQITVTLDKDDSNPVKTHDRLVDEFNQSHEKEAIEVVVPEEHVNVEENSEELEPASFEQQIKHFVDQFDEAAIRRYEETQDAVLELIESKYQEFKAKLTDVDIETECPTEMFFIPQDDPLFNNWMNNTQYVPLLKEHDKLSDEFIEKHDLIKSKLQIYQMLFLGYRYETDEESAQYLSNVDNQVLYAVSTVFSLQLKTTVRTVFGAYIRGVLNEDEYNEKIRLIQEIKDTHVNYLATLDLPALRLEEVYEDTLSALEIILELYKNEPEEKTKEKFEKFTLACSPDQSHQ